MTWYLLLVPLAVLVILPLVGFIGCLKHNPNYLYDPGPYAPTIEATPSLVAYWRLGEPSTTPVPSSGGAAVDQTGGFNGDYRVLAPAAADAQRHSPSTAGTISLGVTPGLLADHDDAPNQGQQPCILVDGGYVQIPASDALNPPAFTFECWIDLTGFDQEPEGNYYCLVESTGPATGLENPRSTGFGLYLGPQDPNAPAGPYFWQVWMGDGTEFRQVAFGKQPVDAAQSVLTYLALTFLGNNNSVNDGQNDLNFNLALYLYRPNTQQPLDLAHVQALNSTVNTFAPNTLANGSGGDFFIGTGSNLFPSVAPSFVQVAAAIQPAAVQSVTATYPGAQAAGNFNIVVVGWRGQNAVVQSVTDSARNIYILAVGPVTGTTLRQYIYFAANIKGGNNTVTVTWTAANQATTPDIRILEYAEVTAQGSLDQTAEASGTSASSVCGPVTITSGNELIFAANTTSAAAGAAAAGSGYTSRIITPNKDIAEDQFASAIGSYNATAPLTASGNWVMQMATFRAGPSQRLYPFKGKIQEVALYSKDLSVDSNNVISIELTLAQHELSGGDM